MLHFFVALGVSLSMIPLHAQTTSAGKPEYYPGLDRTAAKSKKSKSKSNSDQFGEFSKAIGAMGGGGADGGKSGRGGRRETNAEGGGSGTSGGAAAGGDLDPGSGTMEACGTLPAHVEKDRVAMIAFRKSCPVANATGVQRMAINDYTCQNGAPKMYLFDADGQCKSKMSVSFGNGGGREAKDGVCPKTCSTNKSNSSPPGYHLTVTHNGTFKDADCLGLAGLEGQGSSGRGVLIHGSNNPGIASSSGCSGVSHANLQAVRSYLGKGALVYNSFLPNQVADGCSNTTGLTHSGGCHLDPGAPNPAGGQSPSGSGATSMLEDWVERARR